MNKRINGRTFQEWAALAGYSEAAKVLTGQGFESCELEWQMGSDPQEVLAENVNEANVLRAFLNEGR